MGRRHIRLLFSALIIALVTTYAFAPILQSGFVQWDDEQNFLTNIDFRGLGLHQLGWAFTTRLVGVYQPIAWLLLAAQYHIWQLHPLGYHLTSLLMHAANSILVFFLAVALTRRLAVPKVLKDHWAEAGCLLGALFFAVHPLRVEVVAWASCQPYLPCAFFSLLCWLIHLKITGNPSSRGYMWRSLLMLCATCAMLCKAVAVTIPLQLIFLDLILSPEPRAALRQAIGDRAKIPLYLLALGMSFVTLWARRGIEQSPYAIDPSPLARLLQAFYAVKLYLEKTIYPQNISAFYAMPDPLPYQTILASLMVITITFLLLWLVRRRFPAAPLIALSSLVILLPNLGLTPISSAVAADRYSYMASIGPCSMLAMGWLALIHWRFSLRFPLFIGFLAGAVVLTLVCRAQSRIWHDSTALWQHALAHGGDAQEIVHNNLGMAYFRENKWQDAAAEFSRAIAINPHYALAHANRGVLFLKQGQYEKGAVEFNEALRWSPASYQARMGLAVIALTTQTTKEARAHLFEAMRIHPADPGALDLMARILVKEHDIENAQRFIAESLAANPFHGALYNTQGLIFLLTAKIDAAALSFEHALALDPHLDEAYLNLADTRMEQGRFDEAMSLYQAALKTPQPREPVLFGMGRALMAKGRFPEALSLWGELLQKNPNHALAHQNMGLAFSALGQYPAALMHMREAVRLIPASGKVDVRKDLIGILHRAGLHKEAATEEALLEE